MDDDRRGMAWWCATTIFLSAFLLFQVQPIISKMILPWFGGSPAVWSTCMLFFQILLLGGYAYSHFLHQRPARQQAAIHTVLLVVSLILLPIIPRDSWKPQGSDNPTMRILWLLAANVGLPYFLLSTTGPLVQAWFNRACPFRSVYRLYALSNVGSLGALLSYPFLVEPAWGTTTQGMIWSIGYGVFALLAGGLTLVVGRIPKRDVATERHGSDGIPVSWADRGLWILLPALASMTLLAVTNHLCQDVAVVPFLWVAPLSLYLITFIICFDNPRWYLRRLYASLTMLSLVWIALVTMRWYVRNLFESGNFALRWLPRWFANFVISNEIVVTEPAPIWVVQYFREPLMWLNLDSFNDSIVKHVSMYLTAMFGICMLCHGELANRKPIPRHLTSYFLMISAGGAIGGTFVALICPAITSSYLELNLSLLGGYLVALIVSGILLGRTIVPAIREHRWIKAGLAGVVVLEVAGLALVATAQVLARDTNDIVTLRSFYGILHVEDIEVPNNVAGTDEFDDMIKYRNLSNGHILHGRQFQSDQWRMQPTTYFCGNSGIGIAILNFPRQTNLRVAVVGLGTGTIAAYGESGDTYHFFEINPQVEKVANEYFTYLRESPADIAVEVGDARLSMESYTASQEYDILALDAFSGDAIPVHLLTLESMRLYLKHLKPDGIIAVHISNLHLELDGVVARIAKELGLRAIQITGVAQNSYVEFASDWVLLTRNHEFLELPDVRAVSQHINSQKRQQTPLWTDQYSNLLSILKSNQTYAHETYLDGRVVDQSGKGLAKASLRLTRSRRSDSPTAKPEVVESLTADGDGRFEIELLNADFADWEYQVRGEAAGKSLPTQHLTEDVRNAKSLLITSEN